MRFLSFKHIAFFLSLTLLACGGGGDDPGGGGDPTGPTGGNGGGDNIPEPKPATLVFPEDESECLEGEVIDLENSKVTFEWNPAEDADSYQLRYTNLETGVTLLNTTTSNTVEITLQRGAPYSWSVTSQANDTEVTAESEEWRFYNQGPGIENYAPFPAEAVSPDRGATLATTSSVDLIWQGSDVDGDLQSYEVFFGTTNPPETLLESTEETSVTTQVNSGSTYYWQIKSIDAFGNSSMSEIFEFRIQ